MLDVSVEFSMHTITLKLLNLLQETKPPQTSDEAVARADFVSFTLSQYIHKIFTSRFFVENKKCDVKVVPNVISKLQRHERLLSLILDKAMILKELLSQT